MARASSWCGASAGEATGVARTAASVAEMGPDVRYARHSSARSAADAGGVAGGAVGAARTVALGDVGTAVGKEKVYAGPEGDGADLRGVEVAGVL